MKPEEIARIAYEIERAYRASLGDGDDILPAWHDVPRALQDAVTQSVAYVARNLDKSPRDLHERWREERARGGWKYGRQKDTKTKRHPWMVPYGALPDAAKSSRCIFCALVKALT